MIRFIKIAIEAIINAVIGFIAATICLFIFASILSVIFAFLFKTYIGIFLMSIFLIFIGYSLLKELICIGKDFRNDISNKIKRKKGNK